MKKAISAPLCSAFLTPGLGQIINEDIKKGLIILASVFILLTAGAVKLYLMLSSAAKGFAGDTNPGADFFEHFFACDFTTLWVIIGVFALVWLYSVVDALFRGLQVDAAEKEKNP